MMDMGVYPLQAARYVTGEEPVKISARSYKTRPEIYTQAEEVMLFDLNFPSGAVASLATGFHAGFNYLKVSAENGRFELEPFSGEFEKDVFSLMLSILSKLMFNSLSCLVICSGLILFRILFVLIIYFIFLNSTISRVLKSIVDRYK